MRHSIRPLLVRWPATTCALVLLVMSILIAPLDLEYDDSGLGSLLFLINSIFGFFFHTAGHVSIPSAAINGFPITAPILYYLAFRFTFCVIYSSTLLPDGSENGLAEPSKEQGKAKA